jgi:hypothetical protein
VHLGPPDDFVARFISSPLVEWDDKTPKFSPDRLGLLLDLAERTVLLDPVGIQWLPSLALNELPPAFAGADVEPQDLFERKTFRLLTASFRLDGVRYGESARGKRLPDSVVHWTHGGAWYSAMVDCKSASSGYQMDPDHLLRFEEYWEQLSTQLVESGRQLSHLIIVSSYFPGPSDGRHPYHGRAKQILERTGLGLTYIKAADLCLAAARIEADDLPLAARRLLPWSDILDAGLVSSADFNNAIDAVT